MLIIAKIANLKIIPTKRQPMTEFLATWFVLWKLDFRVISYPFLVLKSIMP